MIILLAPSIVGVVLKFVGVFWGFYLRFNWGVYVFRLGVVRVACGRVGH